MDHMATQTEQAGLSHLRAEAEAPRLPLGAAALVVALLSGGLWVGLICLLDKLL